MSESQYSVRVWRCFRTSKQYASFLREEFNRTSLPAPGGCVFAATAAAGTN